MLTETIGGDSSAELQPACTYPRCPRHGTSLHHSPSLNQPFWVSRQNLEKVELFFAWKRVTVTWLIYVDHVQQISLQVGSGVHDHDDEDDADDDVQSVSPTYLCSSFWSGSTHQKKHHLFTQQKHPCGPHRSCVLAARLCACAWKDCTGLGNTKFSLLISIDYWNMTLYGHEINMIWICTLTFLARAGTITWDTCYTMAQHVEANLESSSVTSLWDPTSKGRASARCSLHQRHPSNTKITHDGTGVLCHGSLSHEWQQSWWESMGSLLTNLSLLTFQLNKLCCYILWSCSFIGVLTPRNHQFSISDQNYRHGKPCQEYASDMTKSYQIISIGNLFIRMSMPPTYHVLNS